MFVFCRTSLHIASYHGHQDIVTAFLNHADIDVAIKDTYGWTALNVACFFQHENVIELLQNYIKGNVESSVLSPRQQGMLLKDNQKHTGLSKNVT